MAATATSTPTSATRPGSCAQTSEASASRMDVVPVRTAISATAANRVNPPPKVISSVRMDGANAPWPDRAISRKLASDVSSQHRNSTIRSSAVTRPTMARVNRAMPR